MPLVVFSAGADNKSDVKHKGHHVGMSDIVYRKFQQREKEGNTLLDINERNISKVSIITYVYIYLLSDQITHQIFLFLSHHSKVCYGCKTNNLKMSKSSIAILHCQNNCNRDALILPCFCLRKLRPILPRHMRIWCLLFLLNPIVVLMFLLGSLIAITGLSLQVSYLLVPLLVSLWVTCDVSGIRITLR
jgi:hypothetical protein